MLYAQEQKERPKTVAECNNITDADKWRQDIIKDIGDKVTEIQNAGLGEHKIRTLNDEINQLLEDKRQVFSDYRQWDRRIKELGGPDYSKLETKLYDRDGVELPGSGGYKYFGAAKDLPGVRELFYRESMPTTRRNIKDLQAQINYEYYGLMRDGNDYLKEFEDEQSNEDRDQAVRDYIEANREKLSTSIPEFENLGFEDLKRLLSDDGVYDAMQRLQNDARMHEFEATKNKEAEILEQKKKELMDKYVYGVKA